MKITRQNVDTVIIRYFEKKLNPEELHFFHQWLDENPENKEYYMDFKKVHFLLDNNDVTIPDIEKEFKENLKIIGADKRNSFARKKIYWGIVASIAVFIFSFTLLLNKYNATDIVEPSEVCMPISDSVENYILPDGTRTIVAKGSNLKYMSDFLDCRNVYLKGTAYFEVVPDSTKPFVVNIGFVSVHVLGTKFNVYQNHNKNSVQIWVTEGHVLVENEITKEKQELFAGENCVVYKDSLGQKKTNLNENFFSWKTKKLVFKDTPIKNALYDLGICYSIPFTTDTTMHEENLINGTFDNIGIDQLKSILEITLSANIVDHDSLIIIEY